MNLDPLFFCAPAAYLLARFMLSATYRRISAGLNHAPRRMLFIVLAALAAGLVTGFLKGLLQGVSELLNRN